MVDDTRMVWSDLTTGNEERVARGEPSKGNKAEVETVSMSSIGGRQIQKRGESESQGRAHGTARAWAAGGS